MNISDFPNNLRVLRTARGYTQAYMGHKLHIQRQSYCNYENGQRSPSLEITSLNCWNIRCWSKYFNYRKTSSRCTHQKKILLSLKDYLSPASQSPGGHSPADWATENEFRWNHNLNILWTFSESLKSFLPLYILEKKVSPHKGHTFFCCLTSFCLPLRMPSLLQLIELRNPPSQAAEQPR